MAHPERSSYSGVHLSTAARSVRCSSRIIGAHDLISDPAPTCTAFRTVASSWPLTLLSTHARHQACISSRTRLAMPPWAVTCTGTASTPTSASKRTTSPSHMIRFEVNNPQRDGFGFIVAEPAPEPLRPTLRENKVPKHPGTGSNEEGGGGARPAALSWRQRAPPDFAAGVGRPHSIRRFTPGFAQNLCHTLATLSIRRLVQTGRSPTFPAAVRSPLRALRTHTPR